MSERRVTGLVHSELESERELERLSLVVENSSDRYGTPDLPIVG
jgi:hypothetical protein